MEKYSKDKIIKNNRKIADFLNFKLLSDGNEWGYETDEIMYENKLTKFDRVNVTFENLKFHSDWNWLMVVVNAIENTGKWYFIITDCRCEIKEKSSYPDCVEIKSNDKITAVWCAVIEFIKKCDKKNIKNLNTNIYIND